jgi:hypothetical protein
MGDTSSGGIPKRTSSVKSLHLCVFSRIAHLSLVVLALPTLPIQSPPDLAQPAEETSTRTFSIANSSSAFTLISRAFSIASCLINATYIGFRFVATIES